MKNNLKFFGGKNLVAVFMLLINYGFAQDGSLDASFGDNGVTFRNVGVLADSQGVEIEVQSDGKIVQVGSSFNGTDFDFAVMRYNIDGSFDNTFGTNGIVILDYNNIDNFALDIDIQIDGKIVIVGGIKITATEFDFAVLRLTSNGILDNSFGTNGKVQTDFLGLNVPDFAQKVVIQTDGRIVVAGFAYGLSGAFEFAVARYNSDGNLDTTFGANGKVQADFYNSDLDDQAVDLLIQPDSKIVVVGISKYTNDLANLAMLRLNQDGSLDTSFDIDGKLITEIGSNENNGWSVAMQPDGKILVAGDVEIDNDPNVFDFNFAITRYNLDGSLDDTFGQNGVVKTDLGSAYDSARAIIVQNDGKILVGGITNENYAMVRYNPDGTIDTIGFGTNGKVILQTPDKDICTAMKLQNDGKILLSGISSNGFTTLKFVVLRFSNPSLSTNEINLNEQVTIYPNPATNVLNLNNFKNKDINAIKIIDVLGKTVKEVNENVSQIDIESLQNGFYFLEINSDGKSYYTKFLKQ